jgi:capsule polysaccharide export protein KpsE/RkpR
MSGIPAGAGSAGISAGLLGSRSQGGPLIGIVGSRTAQDDLIDRFDLQHVYGVRKRDDARKILNKRTSTTEDKPTGIISIVVTDRDPRRARDLAAAYVEELNKLVVAMDTSSAHRERAFLEERLKQAQAELQSSEQQLGHFSSRTGTMNAEVQSKAMLDATSKLQGELIAAESELHGLQAIYSDGNVRIEQAKARVATLNAELQKMTGEGGNADSDSYDSSLYPSLRQLPLLGVAYADLYRQTKIQEAAFEFLSKQLESARIQEAKEIPSVKVLDPPVIAERKSFPPRLLVICAGAFFGFLFGCLVVVNREVWLRIDDSNPWKVLLREIAASLPKPGSHS